MKSLNLYGSFSFFTLVLLNSIQYQNAQSPPSNSQSISALLILILVYQIADLDQTNSTFTTQASLWTASSLKSTVIYTQCGSTYVLGGYNILGGFVTSKGQYYQRIYTNLAAHNIIYFTLTIWAIDSWTSNIFNNDRFQLQFDSTLIDGYNYQNSNFPSQLCGSTSYNDLSSIRLFGRVSHSATILTLQVINMINQASSSASVAFRDINLLMVNNNTAPTSTQLCAVAPISSGTSACACLEGKYQSPSGSGTCYACNSGCSSCFGSSASECYQCTPGYTFNGNQCVLCNQACSFCSGTTSNQCSGCSAGYWLSNNNTCISSCPSPLIRTSDATQSYCSSPCNLSQYVMWDGSCSSSCTSPLQQNVVYDNITLCNYTCSTSQFLFWNGTCADTCSSPLVITIQNMRKFCTYPCSSSEFLYPNGSCISTCSSPLSQKTEGNRQFCFSACSFGQYLYWNGSCSNSCDLPLSRSVIQGNNFCIYPCRSSEYLHWNGSCLSSCASPLMMRNQTGNLYCDYSCLLNQFLYWNGSCLNSCDSPFHSVISNERAFCNSPCQNTSDFIFINGTCSSSCVYPFQSHLDGSTRFCQYTCAVDYYLYPNKTCLSTCNTPFVQTSVRGSLHCDNPCLSGEYFSWNGACLKICEYPLIAQGSTYGDLCVLPCSNMFDFYHEDTQTCVSKCNGEAISYQGLFMKCVSNVTTAEKATLVEESGLLGALYEHVTQRGGFTFIAITRLLQYVCYLDIQLPDRLERLISNQGKDIVTFNFGPRMPRSIESKFEKSELSSAFAKRGLHSRFLVNCWGSFSLLLTLVLSALLFDGFERVSAKKKWTDLQAFSERLRRIFKWNLCLVVFTINMGDFLLYASLELGALSLNRNLTIISIIVSLLTLALCLSLLVGAYVSQRGLDNKKVSPLSNSQLQKNIPMDLVGRSSLFEVIKQGFREENKFCRHFYFIYTIRFALPMLLSASFVNVPIVQTVMNTSVGIQMLGFIILKRPIRNRLNNIQLIIMESLVLFINFCLVGLNIMDMNQKINNPLWSLLGDLIIIGFLGINSLIVSVLIIKIVKETKSIYKAHKLQKTRQFSDYFSLLVPIFQQEAFGFEEIAQASSPNIQKGNSIKSPSHDEESSVNIKSPKNLVEVSNEQSTNEKQNKGCASFNELISPSYSRFTDRLNLMKAESVDSDSVGLGNSGSKNEDDLEDKGSATLKPASLTFITTGKQQVEACRMKRASIFKPIDDAGDIVKTPINQQTLRDRSTERETSSPKMSPLEWHTDVSPISSFSPLRNTKLKCLSNSVYENIRRRSMLNNIITNNSKIDASIIRELTDSLSVPATILLKKKTNLETQ